MDFIWNWICFDDTSDLYNKIQMGIIIFWYLLTNRLEIDSDASIVERAGRSHDEVISP
jgi:hypothetical protein